MRRGPTGLLGGIILSPAAIAEGSEGGAISRIMRHYYPALFFAVFVSSAWAGGERSAFPRGDFEQGRGKWDLIEGAKIADTPAGQQAAHGRRCLELSLDDERRAKVQLPFKIKRPFKRLLFRLEILAGEDAAWESGHKAPIHAGIRQGSNVGAFLIHRYLHLKDLTPGAWTSIEREISWDDLLAGFKTSDKEEAVFEIELMPGKGKILFDNIEVAYE